MRRWRVEEQIERLTKRLRSRQGLPRGFYEILDGHDINTAATVLTDLFPDQGCCLVGTLLTSGGRIIHFDIDFAGDASEPASEWREALLINEWKEVRLEDERPKQGSPLDVAARWMRAGRL